MGLAVAVEQLGAAVGVVVALQDDVDVVLVENRGELGAQDHAVGVRVVKAGAVDVLMDGDDAEFGVRVGSDRFLDGFFMLGHIVVVGVEHDEQAGAVENSSSSYPPASVSP